LTTDLRRGSVGNEPSLRFHEKRKEKRKLVPRLIWGPRSGRCYNGEMKRWSFSVKL